jgi:hypothetical protein
MKNSDINNKQQSNFLATIPDPQIPHFLNAKDSNISLNFRSIEDLPNGLKRYIGVTIFPIIL